MFHFPDHFNLILSRRRCCRVSPFWNSFSGPSFLEARQVEPGRGYGRGKTQVLSQALNTAADKEHVYTHMYTSLPVHWGCVCHGKGNLSWPFKRAHNPEVACPACSHVQWDRNPFSTDSSLSVTTLLWGRGHGARLACWVWVTGSSLWALAPTLCSLEVGVSTRWSFMLARCPQSQKNNVKDFLNWYFKLKQQKELE